MKRLALLTAIVLSVAVLIVNLHVRRGELRSDSNGKRRVWLKHSCPCDSGKVIHRFRL